MTTHEMMPKYKLTHTYTVSFETTDSQSMFAVMANLTETLKNKFKNLKVSPGSILVTEDQ